MTHMRERRTMTTPGITRLRRAFEVNRTFMAASREINAAIMNTFLGVAMWGGDEKPDDPISLKDLAKRLGLSNTTISNHLRYLGFQRRIDVPGLRLVEVEEHPVDRRQKLVRLTRDGIALRDRLLFILGEGLDDDDGATTRSNLAS